MTVLRRMVLVRHGETVGNSSTRFHGRSDVALSAEGREQVRGAALGLGTELFDLVVASPLQRAWQTAQLLRSGSARLEPGFREVDFGRWEGLTAEEIEARDPVLHREWRAHPATFDYPGGEARADFNARVHAGLARIEQSGATTVLVAAHKGVIRTIVTKLYGSSLEPEVPALGGVIGLSRNAAGAWYLGRTGSSPG